MNNEELKIHNTFVCLGASNHTEKDRETNDFYATEPNAVVKLLEKEKFNNNVWECCCGKGHISKVLLDNEYNVYSTDLINRGFGDAFFNFLEYKKTVNADIITNPPYKNALEIINHALEITSKGNKIAMLLKIQFLESIERGKFFAKYPPKYVYVFSKRTYCAKNGDFNTYHSSAMCYAWFIWINGEYEEPIIRWI